MYEQQALGGSNFIISCHFQCRTRGVPPLLAAICLACLGCSQPMGYRIRLDLGWCVGACEIHSGDGQWPPCRPAS
jgi:hypothetical protein